MPRRLIRATLALVVIHAGLTLYYWLPAPGARSILTPTWDLLGVAVAFALYGALREGVWLPRRAESDQGGERGRGARVLRAFAGGALSRLLDRAFLGAVVVVLAAVFVLGVGQGFARREFGYDVIVALHVPYVPELFRMMYDGEPLALFLLYCALLALGGLAVLGALWAAAYALSRAARETRGRYALLAAVGGYLTIAGVSAGVQPSVAKEAVSQIRYAIHVEERLAATASDIERDSAALSAVNPFQRMDDPPSIYLFTVESYGDVVFRDEEFWSWAEPFMAESEEAAHDAGYAIRSGYLDCPVFGGSSWMAQASMKCGTPIDDQERYDSLFRSDAICAPRFMNEAGYRTSVVAGNITFLDEGYRDLFPFDGEYFNEELGYEGRRYSWSKVPDQYAIDFVHDREVLEYPDAPRYIHYMLTNSHHPWDEVPPFIDDWDMGDGSEAFTRVAQSFDNRFTGGAEYREGYWATVEYSMKSAVEYLDRIPEDDALVVILGDHQPREPVADMEGTWWTPVHMLSRDPSVVERLEDLGYAPGIVPPDLDPEDGDDAPAPLSDLFRHIFHAYGYDAAG